MLIPEGNDGTSNCILWERPFEVEGLEWAKALFRIVPSMSKAQTMTQSKQEQRSEKT
jgi:hypothetical protein